MTTSHHADKPARWHSPHTREEAAEEEGTVALDEGGEEGEDAVDGERDEERLPTAYPVSQSAPEERPYHHTEIYNQTCGDDTQRCYLTRALMSRLSSWVQNGSRPRLGSLCPPLSHLRWLKVQTRRTLSLSSTRSYAALDTKGGGDVITF